ncbi:hypothetical protein RND81_09G247600 [Saponaria officinalis]|uniref:Protein kinase domain-containing protein n=1 Tax=Saponaria officinalis TaxID=3572 RepID=A0AAW1IRU7_SAPOF
MKDLLRKIFMLMKSRNKRKNKEVQRFVSKEEYFIKNGAILLEKKIALSQGKDSDKGHKFFSEDEIRKATRNYDSEFIIGSYQMVVTYKGTLDGRNVSIATSEEHESYPELVEHFLTQISLATVSYHNNLLRVYGCCLETYVPMVVYQLFPRSSDVHGRSHGDMALQMPMKWRDRLRVASDIGYALSYMHNAFSKPVVIRDIASSSIHIDTPFCAKLTNFAHSVFITPGKKNLQLPIHGALGYMDPEYIETREVTEKCDVYNFGVLMLELLTARDPVEMARHGKDLVDEFVSAVKTNGGMEMIDKHVFEEGNMDEILRFVRLALTCVAKKGVARPTMTEVVDELWMIQDQGK